MFLFLLQVTGINRFLKLSAHSDEFKRARVTARSVYLSEMKRPIGRTEQEMDFFDVNRPIARTLCGERNITLAAAKYTIVLSFKLQK